MSVHSSALRTFQCSIPPRLNTGLRLLLREAAAAATAATTEREHALALATFTASYFGAEARLNPKP